MVFVFIGLFVLFVLAVVFATLWLTKTSPSAECTVSLEKYQPEVVSSSENKVVTVSQDDKQADPLLPFLTKVPADPPSAPCKPYVAGLILERGGMSVEIGPGINSVIPQGENNRFIDMYENDDESNPHTNVDANLVHIDYVWSPGQSYADIVPEGERFRNAVSSHCIEHVPCLVKYLCNIREILHEDGKFYVIIPHRTYMFDHYRSRSTLGDVVASYKTGRQLPKAPSSLDALLMRSVNDPSKYWNEESPPPRVVTESAESMNEMIDERLAMVSNDEYVDDHHWVYDEYSFSFIVQNLRKLGLVDFEVETSHKPIRPYNEFLVVLRAV